MSSGHEYPWVQVTRDSIAGNNCLVYTKGISEQSLDVGVLEGIQITFCDPFVFVAPVL